jgi:hypothetical protein
MSNLGRRNMTTTRVYEYNRRDYRPEIFIYAKTCQRNEEPANLSIIDVRTEYRTAEYTWPNFKEIPDAKELLRDEWDVIKREDRALHKAGTKLQKNIIWR